MNQESLNRDCFLPLSVGIRTHMRAEASLPYPTTAPPSENHPAAKKNATRSIQALQAAQDTLRPNCRPRRDRKAKQSRSEARRETPDTPSAPARKAPYEPANGKNRHVGRNAARHIHARARENNRRKTCRYNKYGLPLYLESHPGGRLYTPRRGTVCPLALRSQRPRAGHQRGEQTVLNKNGRSGKNYQS